MHARYVRRDRDSGGKNSGVMNRQRWSRMFRAEPLVDGELAKDARIESSISGAAES